MARRALLVGINDYRGLSDLRGCINDISNMRNVLKTYLGFGNNDIRVLADARAGKEAILHRLRYMVRLAEPGDYMVFHYAGHGAQVRDRNNDELDDGMDEILCPWDFSWDGCFILDDDLDEIFSKLPKDCLLEVFLDCCHSGTATRGIATENISSSCSVSKSDGVPKSRFLDPPPDIQFRYEGDEDELPLRGFTSGNRSGMRSTLNHILWSASRSDQPSADARIEGTYNGAFTYYLCKHIRDTGGDISRRNLLERVRNSLRHNSYHQVPQLECMNEAAYEHRTLQLPPADEPERLLYLTTPYMRGNDVRRVQEALKKMGFDMIADGVFGPYTHTMVKRFQAQNELIVDGAVGPVIRNILFGS